MPIILSPSNYFPLDTLSAAIKIVGSAYWFAPGMGIWLKMETQGCVNWHLKAKNVKFFVISPPPPILGQTIDIKHLDAMRFLIYIIQQVQNDRNADVVHGQVQKYF